MIFLLDTNTCSDLMRGDAITISRSEAITDRDIAVVCPIVRGEILFGITRLPPGSRRQDLQLKADTLFAQLPCYTIPASAADHYAAMKIEGRRKSLGLDDNDLWIASTALAFGATLVTRDKDFLQIDSLVTVNWSV